MSFQFNFTQDKLAAVLHGNPYVDHWYNALCQILPDYDITSVNRVAAFVAQAGHESGGFMVLHENLNYQAASLCRVWPHYFNASNAAEYAHNPEKIANRAYANRMGNGPEESGDGWKYCGRGLFQLTGHDNYQAFADSIQTDIDQIPEFLQTFEGAVQSACWFWENNNLNPLADAGDMLTMTKRINGGTLGLEERTANFHRALQVFQG
jgi:putative chitinase